MREVTGVGVTTAGVGVVAEAMIVEEVGAGAMIGGAGVGAMTAETEGGVVVLGR